jgi:hypothetical protein
MGYRIKNMLTVASLMVLATSMIHASRTVFIPRSITTDSTLQLALTNYHWYHQADSLEDKPIMSLYLTPFFQQSRNKKELARYFLPNNTSCLNIQENGTGNIGSLSLGLISTPGTSFSSQVRICPQRRIYGTHISLYADLSDLACGMWFNIAFAAVRAEHDLHLRETNISNPGTLPGLQTATQALNNPTWIAGKLSPCKLRKSGVDDIQFKWGYDWYFCDEQSHIGLYVNAIAPTGKREQSRHLFEPIVGRKHGGIGIGLNADWALLTDCDSQADFMLDAKYTHYFPARGQRVFDVCPNGDWSRFLQVVNAATPAFSVPALNTLTQSVRIAPRGTLDVWAAFHYELCCWNIEAGYNLWWRQAERLCLQCPFPSTIGILDIPGLCSILPATSSTFRINQSIVGPCPAVSDATFTPLTSANINLLSGSQPRSLSHKVYGACSYNTDICETPIMAGVGGSYEFARHHNALEQWTVWGKLGISF